MKSVDGRQPLQLAVELCGIPFKNPLIAASGTCGFGRELAPYYPLSTWGGLSLKGTTLHPRQGNPAPRVAETPLGMLNAVGLQNPGVDAFLGEEVPQLAGEDTVLIANIAGENPEEMAECVRRVCDSPIQMVELNISCPNVAAGGMAFGVYPETVEAVTRTVRAACTKPLIVKLSPNVADIRENARAAEAGGADAISLINTLTGMAVDPVTRRPVLGNVTGGLSGPAVKPVALRMVHQCAGVVKIPIIGLGGISSGRDVVEFLLCGASAVMIGSATIADPCAVLRILEELRTFMEENGVSDVRDFIGGLEI